MLVMTDVTNSKISYEYSCLISRQRIYFKVHYSSLNVYRLNKAGICREYINYGQRGGGGNAISVSG